MSVELKPHERAALVVAWAQVQRGEFPMPACATVCVAALARLYDESLSGGNPSEKSASGPADHRGIVAARSSEGGNGGQALDVTIQSREPVARTSLEQIHAKDADSAPSIAHEKPEAVNACGCERACAKEIGYTVQAECSKEWSARQADETSEPQSGG